MARLVDAQLMQIKKSWHKLLMDLDDLVTGACMAINDPKSGFGLSLEPRDEDVNRLIRQLQEQIMVTCVRFAPVATDNRFLLAILESIPRLVHMGDSAKQVCQLAPLAGSFSQNLLSLVSLTEDRAGVCFDVLRQMEADGMVQGGSLIADRREIEEAFDHVLSELPEIKLTARELELQAVVAHILKEICISAAGIESELALYQGADGARAA